MSRFSMSFQCALPAENWEDGGWFRRQSDGQRKWEGALRPNRFRVRPRDN
jgi:hypothetical protein